MCGRYTFAPDLSQIGELFPGFEVPEELAPRYNIAPTQKVPVILNDGRQRIELVRWGLIPSWAKDPAIGNRLINARAETLAEKPSFRSAFKRRRCLILADGFYEWQKTPGQRTKTPHYIRLRSGDPFAFAGLWESWRSPDDDRVLSCTIVTTSPNPLIASIHNRMPVILDPTVHERWLREGEQPKEEMAPLLAPYPPEQMEAYPVSTLVNSPKNDVPACIEPAES
jgi:putative SOS response-associated peptidase YedK